MSKRTMQWWLMAVAVVAFGAAAFLAMATPAAAQDPEADMEMYMKLSQPGDHHAHLAKLAGKWKTEGKAWMAPGAEPSEMNGKSEAVMVLGGRFLKTTYTGEYMGQPFEGLGYDGYDNMNNEHVGMWMDTMGTYIGEWTGSCSAGGKVLTSFSEMKDPSGGTVKMKGVTTILDDDHYKVEMWVIAPDGSEFKNMEFTATRM